VSPYAIRDRVFFECHVCGNSGNLSYRHHKRLVDNHAPLICLPCRQQRTLTNKHDAWAAKRATEQRETLTVNGCTLVAHYRGRCRDYLTCSGYEKCLYEVSRRNWSGWRSLR
jgi:hypothetical protein